MEVRFRLDNIDDIKWLKSFPREKRAQIIQQCISLGRSVLSVQPKLILSPSEFMQPFKDDINNHLVNVKNVMDTSSRLVFEPILGRFDKLCSQIDELTNITSKSALKGKMGEELISRSIRSVFPDIEIKDMSKRDHETDFHLTIDKTKILLEVKTYTNAVPFSQIEKLYQDIQFTGFKYAILASTTSAIAKRKEFDWEVYKDCLIVYIANTGMNGIGVVCAIQFILATVSIFGSQSSEYRNIRLDHLELDQFAIELGDNIENLLQHLAKYSKLRYAITKFEASTLAGLRDMYTEIIDLESELRTHLHSLAQCYHRKLLPLTNTTLNQALATKDQLHDYIEKQRPNKNEQYIRILDIIRSTGISVSIENDEWVLVLNGKVIGKTESSVHKVYLVFEIFNGETYQFTGYEKNRGKQLLLQICQENYPNIEKMLKSRVN